MEKRRTHINDIIEHISNHGLCIVLTNANLLGCETCNYYSMTTLAASSQGIHGCLPPYREADATYQGHYIVVCGYDITCQKIVYRNPSLNDRECVMSFQTFENARTSYGTDDDVIFVDTAPKTSLDSIPMKMHSHI